MKPTQAGAAEVADRVAVIGAGLGGLAAAVTLAAAGFKVDIFEKNRHLGGKLNRLVQDGFGFDLGPSILTLPQIFRQLFERAGRCFDDYVPLRPVLPHWRNVFEDGTVIDLDPDPVRMHAELAKAGPDLEGPYEAFLEYSRRQYDLVDEGYFRHGLDTLPQFLRHYGWRIFRLDLFSTMHRSVCRRLPSPYLRDIFDFFIKYVGSSALRAPGFMNLMPHIQFGYGLWYVDGGMHRLALGLERLLRELGVGIHTDCEVTGIERAAGRVTGVVAGGARHAADWVVCNMEVRPACERLLAAPPAALRRLDRFEPACSGLVIHLGVNRVYDLLAHHNFFYSAHQAEHFDTVFRRHELPTDPTLYVVAPSRTDPAVAPPGCDVIKVLPHIPWINDDRPLGAADYAALRDRVLEKLERMGLTDLRRHIVLEHVWTPLDIRRMYYSDRGAIYGTVSDLWKNFAFKAPKRSPEYSNLFFVGGTVNPGGGMPMVTLSGLHAGDMIRAAAARKGGNGHG